MICTDLRVVEKRFLALILCHVLWSCVHVWFSNASQVGLHKHTQTCRLLPPFCHQVMDERSDMDRGLEVSGGANGATPIDDSSSEDLGTLP